MDLGTFASRFDGVRWSGDEKFRAHCPCLTHHDGDPDCSLVARVVKGQIVVACFADLGDSTETILSAVGLTASDLRTQTPPALPPKTPAETFSANGAHPTPAGNEKPRDVGQWQIEVGYEFKHWFGAIPENQRALVAGNDEDALVETLVNQAKDSITDQKRPFWPLPELNDTDLDEELRRLAGAVVKAFRDDYLPAIAEEHLPRQQERYVIPFEDHAAALLANEEYLKRDPVVAGLCYSSAISMVTGGKHAGKSTLARWLAICVAKGYAFLDREVQQGPVLYLASDDEAMAARQELIRLGWIPGDSLQFLSMSAVTVDQAAILKSLTEYIQQTEVKLIVMDMLFDWARIGDEMSYAQTREALGTIQAVASAGKCHIVTIHHSPKHASSRQDAAVTALGSQGLAARVSPIILVRKHGPGVHSVVTTSVRDPRGEGIDERRLTLNEDGSMALGKTWADWMQAEVFAPRVLELFESEPEQEMTRLDVQQALEISQQLASASLVQLYREGRIGRAGSGKKGSPFRYYLPLTKISDSNAKSEGINGTRGHDHVPSRRKSESDSQQPLEYKSKLLTPPGDEDDEIPDEWESRARFYKDKDDE